VVSGLARPIHITHAGDGTDRLFVEQQGIIRIVQDEAVRSTPFLDITDRVRLKVYDEGLLSLAFPPRYAERGHFYVGYVSHNGHTVVSRFAVTDDPNVADPESEEILIEFEAGYSINIHNGGRLAFGPGDGYLYIANGDGGLNKDLSGDPANNAQNPMSLLGKILRIDVESGAEGYIIPTDNPFYVRSGYRGKIWALGLRNPWHFSFDRQTGEMYVSDVGNLSWEEVNFQPAYSRGGDNYGWRILEGYSCHNLSHDCTAPEEYVPPVAQYSHDGGNCAVIGGMVYRGAEYPELEAVYFYGDWCTGYVWGLREGEEGWETQLVYDAPFGISSFGEDEQGRLYLTDFHGGIIYELIKAEESTPTATLSATATSSPSAIPGSTVTSTPTTSLTTVTTSTTVIPSATMTPSVTPGASEAGMLYLPLLSKQGRIAAERP
jgi:glucose/arabinose dehydrogenase